MDQARSRRDGSGLALSALTQRGRTLVGARSLHQEPQGAGQDPIGIPRFVQAPGEQAIQALHAPWMGTDDAILLDGSLSEGAQHFPENFTAEAAKTRQISLLSASAFAV